MEGDGVPWGGEPVSGPGPGGGGMIRELSRGFGRYRRYLGRLRQNLRETQKFFRDIKCSHNHSCPSSPAGGGGDVAETGLPADPSGKVRPEIINESGNPSYKYFYVSAEQVVQGMKEAQERLTGDAFREKRLEDEL